MTTDRPMGLEMTQVLESCPFCGGKKAFVSSTLDEKWYATCEGDQCAFVGHFDTEAEAVTAWNTRQSSIASLTDAAETRTTVDCRTMREAADELTALRERAAAANCEINRLETCVGWLADVSAATAYDFASKKSTSKSERSRQISIMEKTITMLDGALAPSRSAQDGVKARCQRTIAELEKAILSHPQPSNLQERPA